MGNKLDIKVYIYLKWEREGEKKPAKPWQQITEALEIPGPFFLISH